MPVRLHFPLASPLAVVAVLFPTALAAQTEGSSTLEPVIVSATRLPTPEEQVASSVTVITGADIERRQNRGVADALRDVPGLNVVQTGSPGGTTQVFIRGANANHTKVFIDGMPVNDPSDANGAFDFGPVLAGDIERIEVLRGPQSGLYGSDAIGGVINIVTKRGAGPLQLRGTVEGGSFGTFNQFGSASGSVERFDYAFNVNHFRSAATPVTPLGLLPPGRRRIDDFYDNDTLSAKLGAGLTENADVNLTTRFAMTTLRFTGDDFSTVPSTPAAAQSTQETQQLVTRGEGRLRLFDGRFEQRLGFGYLRDDGRFQGADLGFGTPTPIITLGERLRTDWLGTLHVTDDHALLIGVEHETERLRNLPTVAENGNTGAFVELQSGFFERLYTSASVRMDDNDRFGSVTTYRFAPAFLVHETDTKLKASVGSGFKAPTLTQLFVSFPDFNFFANPNLKPERSVGWDAGFEQALFEKQVGFGASWFHNDIDNLIIANDANTRLVNLAKATTYGVESFITWRPLDRLSFRGDYTYTFAQDEVLHQELLRRPKNRGSLNAQWRPTDRASLSTTLLVVGQRVDGNRDFSIPRLTASGYTLVNIAGAYELGDGIAAFARVDNLFDQRYQDPTGFLRPGIGAFAGLRITLGPFAAAK